MIVLLLLDFQEPDVIRATEAGAAEVPEPEELMQGYWTPSCKAPRKVTQDVFGQQHTTIASDLVECMHCGRKIVAGAPSPAIRTCRTCLLILLLNLWHL